MWRSVLGLLAATRTGRGGHRRTLGLGTTGLFAAVSLVVVLLSGSAGASAPLGTTWSGVAVGNALAGTTSVPSDGTGGSAVFTYAYDVTPGSPEGGGNYGNSGEWRFTTTADAPGTPELRWTWAGFHAFFHVTARLVAFVQHPNATVDQVTVVQAGPTDCCTSPSGGFTYAGNWPSSLEVASGDVYGFRLYGTNDDSNDRFGGTLTVQKNLVANGSFERELVPGSTYETRQPGSDDLEGWTVLQGSVDHIGEYWQAGEGRQSLDLDGSGAAPTNGAVEQSFPTTAGTVYDIDFLSSRNPDGALPSPRASVLWNGSSVTADPVTFAGTPTRPSMQWTKVHATVTATGSTSTLRFASLDGSSTVYGIAIDDVSVTEHLSSGGETPPTPVAPVLFGALPATSSQPSAVAGLVQAAVPANTTFAVSFYTSTTCDGTPTLVDAAPSTIGTGSNTNGLAGFAIGVPGLAEGTYVRARARVVGGDPSPFSNCVRVEPNNTSWPNALALPVTGSTPVATQSYLQAQGEARWFTVPIQPNGRATITLRNLPADFDLVVFGDIQAAYDALQEGASPNTGPNLAADDLTKQAASTPADAFNTSQYNASSWEASNWDPTLNTAGFSASQWSPSQWSASQWSPSQWSASQWSASQWSPSQWSASQWSPSQWSASQWSPSQWSASQWSASQWSPSQWSGIDPAIFSSAQTASLMGISARDGTAEETISVNTWNNTGNLYVRVSGKNGGFDPSRPFEIVASRNDSPCVNVTAPASPPAPSLVPGVTSTIQTVILTDSSRLPDATVAGRLLAFAGRAEVRGVIVDVNADATVRALNAQADANTGCPYAKNLVAERIADIVAAYRAANPVKYVVVVGGDSVIPFARYADPALIGSETMYVPPVKDESASQASLRLGYVLNQDAYGSSQSLTLHGNRFPVPDLPVGRLIETPSEIVGMLDAYTSLAGGVVPTPTSSLVTGYDFLQDAADSVAGNFSSGIGGTANATLITNQGVSPSLTTVGTTPDRAHSWTATDLRRSLLQSGRHDLLFLAGHFSANDALAADFATNVLSTELATSATSFENAIVLSAGCHAGYNIVDGDALPNVTQPLDWAQAFARKRATLVAGTGYQYGDTDFLAYSERIYAELSRQLRITSDPQGQREPVSVGDALVRSKHVYLRSTAAPLSGLDEKALLEATLFGLPMLSVNLPQGRIYEAPDASAVTSLDPAAPGTAGALLGLETAPLTLSPALTGASLQLKVLSSGTLVNGPLATYFRGPAGIVVRPTQPVLPLSSTNVTPPTQGSVLTGVGFRGGTYTEEGGVTPLTTAPATEVRGVHAPFFTDVLFPSQPWAVNYFDALGAGAGTPVAGGTTRLMFTPVQHVSDRTDPTTSVRRTWTSTSFRLFYSGNTSSYCVGGTGAPTPATSGCPSPTRLGTPALAAAPTITGVDAAAGTGGVAFSAHVVGDLSAGVHQVWVTWTVRPPLGQQGTWQSIDLTRDATDPSLWTGTLPSPPPGDISFVVQAVNGVGRVTLDSNNGAFYIVGAIPGTASTAGAAASSLALSAPASGASGAFGTTVTVTATLTSTANGTPLAGKLVTLGIGNVGIPAFTGANGVATASLSLGSSPRTTTAFASFGGDAADLGSADARPFTITPMPTTIRFCAGIQTCTSNNAGPISVLATDPTWFTATLRDTRAPSPAALASRNVFLVFSGGPSPVVVAAKTDAAGRVEIGTGDATLLPGTTYTVAAYFNGAPAPVDQAAEDGNYLPSSQTTTLTLIQPALGLVKTADRASFARVGESVTYTYVLRNTGNTTLTGPFTVSDDKTTVNCPTSPATLAPNATRTCTATFTIRLADFLAGSVTNTAVARATFATAPVVSAVTSLTLPKVAFGTAGRVLFSRLGDIWSVDAAGAPVQLTAGNEIDLTPARSPDGSKVVFSRNGDLWILDAAGLRALTPANTASSVELSPTWSPNGQTIAFSSNRSGSRGTDIWSVRADGTGTATNLTNANGTDLTPAWSPDGLRIAFASDRTGSQLDVYTMTASGGSVTRLTTDTRSDVDPAYAPDGSAIVFSSDRAGGTNGFEIFRVPAAGGAQTRLTTSAGIDAEPVWLPGTAAFGSLGGKIVFTSLRLTGGGPGLFATTSAGASPVRLTGSQALDINPG